MRRSIPAARRAAVTTVTLVLTVATVLVAATQSSGAESPPPSVNTAAAMKAGAWSSNVSVSVSGSSITVASNGVPSTTYWTRPSEYAVPDAGVVVPTAKTAHVAPDPTQVVPISLSVPTVPTWSTTTTATAGGPIGILLSGAPLYDPYEGDGTTVALASNFHIKDAEGNKVYFVDACNGHPGPMGAYHYHGLPTCITDKTDAASGPSHLLGVALDGYPVYGDRSITGKLVKPSQLDACNGIFSATPEFPTGIYHYVLLDTKSSRSSLRCYHGVVSSIHSNFKSPVYMCGLTLAEMYRVGLSSTKEAADKP